MRLRLTTLAAMMRLLPALALVLIAFAHQPMQAGSGAPDLSAYALPDGTIPVICGLEGATDGQGNPIAATKGCEACRLTASLLMPEPPRDLAGILATAGTPVAIVRAPLLSSPAFQPAAPPTAPPLA